MADNTPAGDGGAQPPAGGTPPPAPAAGDGGAQPPATGGDGGGNATPPPAGDGGGDGGAPTEPPTRGGQKPPQSHIIDRKNDKIAKLESELAALKGGGDGGEGDGGTPPPAPNPANPADLQAALQNMPEVQAMQQVAIAQEVGQFTAQHPEFKEFEATIQQWAVHPAYKQVPIAQIAFAVAGEKLMKMGAEAGNKADANAAANAAGGGAGTRTPDGAAKSVPPAGTPEFAAYKAQALAATAATRQAG